MLVHQSILIFPVKRYQLHISSKLLGRIQNSEKKMAIFFKSAAAFHIQVQSHQLGEVLAMALFLLNLTSMTFKKLQHKLFFFMIRILLILNLI